MSFIENESNLALLLDIKSEEEKNEFWLHIWQLFNYDRKQLIDIVFDIHFKDVSCLSTYFPIFASSFNQNYSIK